MSQIQVPKGWDLEKLVDVCVDFQPGFAQGKKNVEGGTIHLRMNNIGSDFKLNFDLVRTINATKDQLEKYKLEKSDVIFNNTNSPKLVGKSVIYEDSKTCLYSNHLTRIKVNQSKLTPKWLLYFFQYKWLKRDFEEMCNKWINQASVGKNKIELLDIPLPSLKTQKKIIQKLDYILGQLEEKKKTIFSIIKQNKEKIDFFEKNWKSFIISNEIENHPHRKEWQVFQLRDLTDAIGDGIHSTPNYVQNSNFYFINGNNLRNGSIVITEKTKMVDKTEFQKYKLELSDKTVLLSINGTIGNLAFYRNEKVILGKSACYINCSDQLDVEFLYYLLQSNLIKNYFRSELTKTSIYNLSLTSVRKTPITLPLIPEQKKIILNIKNVEEKLKIQMTQFENIKKNYDNNITYVNHIQSSVLDTAFSGKLVN